MNRIVPSFGKIAVAPIKGQVPQFNRTFLNKGTHFVKSTQNGLIGRRIQTQTQPKPTSAVPTEAMFCFQCEQTREGKGCKTIGVCGKTPEVAGLQDILIEACKGISAYATRAYDLGAPNDRQLDNWVLGALFSTVTNVNFDADRFTMEFLSQADSMMIRARTMYEAACLRTGKKPQDLTSEVINPEHLRLKSSKDMSPSDFLDYVHQHAKELGVLAHKESLANDDIASLHELILYGLKGTAAYCHHAEVLGQENDEIYKDFHKILDFLGSKRPKTIDELLGMALHVGQLNLKVMEILDKGATEKYGHPEPTKVRVTTIKGKCILVSGHDLKDLEEVLKQTEGKGINVYTHGELLPAHGYPQLKKYKHLVGNYGSAWQMQKLEFAMFPGPILMTTNCIIEPRKSYKDRIFTRSVVGWPGVNHINNFDFTPLIESALKHEGFKSDETAQYTTTGFGRNAVLGVADKIVDAVKAGKLKHFFLIGGCDGSEGERNYFKEMALNAPKDTAILTLACGKYRFNKFEFGDIEGIPRLIDIGQCNDTYSAIQIASALAKAFGTTVNGLPLSFSVSWFEQKAVAVLLTLLSLGIKNIYLGPNLPAFVTPNVLNVLVEKFQIAGTGDRKSVV